MFWDNFYNACTLRGIKPSPLTKELKLASGSITSWKSGKIPNGETLLKISEYLNVSVDYLLGRVSDPTDIAGVVQKCPTYSNLKAPEEQNSNLDELSQELLKHFRKLPFDSKLEVFNYIKDKENQYNQI